MLQTMKEQMVDEEFCDMTIIINETEIKCHKVILARNEYFRTTLKSKFKEVTKCNKKYSTGSKESDGISL